MYKFKSSRGPDHKFIAERVWDKKYNISQLYYHSMLKMLAFLEPKSKNKNETLPGVDPSCKPPVVRCLSNPRITIAPYQYTGNSAPQATRVDYRCENE